MGWVFYWKAAVLNSWRWPHSPFLEVVVTLTLALVLFLGAVKLQVTELGKRWLVSALILGSGTGLIIAIGALPFGLFLNFG